MIYGKKLAQLGRNSAFACAHEADEQDIFIKQRFRLNPLAVFDDALEDLQDFLLKYGTCYLSSNPFSCFSPAPAAKRADRFLFCM